MRKSFTHVLNASCKFRAAIQVGKESPEESSYEILYTRLIQLNNFRNNVREIQRIQRGGECFAPHPHFACQNEVPQVIFDVFLVDS